MIITGAPIEHLRFEDVNYWEEMTEIMEWTKTHVTSVLLICWGAQAALYYHYGIDKYELPKKCSVLFELPVSNPVISLVIVIDLGHHVPHPRCTLILMKETECQSLLN